MLDKEIIQINIDSALRSTSTAAPFMTPLCRKSKRHMYVRCAKVNEPFVLVAPKMANQRKKGCFSFCRCVQGCQIFRDIIYQNGENIPKDNYITKNSHKLP
jgi:translation elongation factor EF-G